jgi:predicted MFS family arabinose efflux permease
MTASRSTQILVVLALANLVSYAARNALFAVYPDLVAAYGIDDSQLGFLQTLFMIPHAAATLSFGWAGDRFDRRKVIAAGMLIAGLAGAAGAFATSYAQLAVSRAAVGLGTAAIVPVANSMLSQIFEGAAKASRLAVFNLGLFLGGVVGFAAGIALGFPNVVIALALPGIALAAMIAMLPVPPRTAVPQARVVAVPDLVTMVRVFFADTRVLLRIPTLRWVIASTSVMAFAAGGYNAWLKEFLVREKGLSDPEATTLLALALCGGLSGILVGARISDRLRRRWVAGRLWTIAIGMAITVPVASLAIVAPKGLGLDIAGIATLFFFSWYHAPMAATVDDLAPPELAVSAQGLVIFTMHMIGTAPSSWIVGGVSEETSLYDAMWVPTAAVVVAAACMMIAARTFAVDHARARGGTAATPSL